MTIFTNSTRQNVTKNHDEDYWLEEYAEYCASADNDNDLMYEDDDTPGYISFHGDDTPTQVNAERLAFRLMCFLSELRHREIQEYHFSYNDEGQPVIDIDFFCHNAGQYGTGRHIFLTS